MKIGTQLQKQRKLHGMSQDELASKLHISRQSVSKWENGATLPSFSNVVAISELFELSLDELIKGDTDLMEKLENDNPKITKTWLVIIVGSIIAVIAMVILKFLRVGMDTIDNVMVVPEIIALAGLLMNINWKSFNKLLSKKAIIWGIIWLALYLIPMLNDFVTGFIDGLNGR